MPHQVPRLSKVSPAKQNFCPKISGKKSAMITVVEKWNKQTDKQNTFSLLVAWENSRGFARSPLELSQNDVWVMSAEIPYWWRALPRSWYCFWLVETRENFVSTNQKHYQDLGSARHWYGISALVTQTSFCEGFARAQVATSRNVSLFSQATPLALAEYEVITTNSALRAFLIIFDYLFIA